MFAPTIDTRSSRREATTARILEAAWNLARRDGLASISLRDLAAQVGMRAPSLYRYFASKNAIYDAMLGESARAFRAVATKPIKETDPRLRLRRRARRFVRFFTEDPLRFELVVQRPIPGFEPSPEHIAVLAANLAEVREDLEAAGVPGQRGIDVWRVVVGGIVTQQNSNAPGGHRWTRLVDEAVDMMLLYYAGRQR